MSDKSFLSRWSRLKKEQSSTPVADPAEQTESPLEAQNNEAGNRELLTDVQAENQPNNIESEPLTDEDMPDIESLNEESDYSAFLSPGVSDELRNLALRKLFNLPQFNIVDGLNDYDEDFSKMPALSQAVVSKMRSWINEKQEEIVDEITGESAPANTESSADETAESGENPLEEEIKITSNSFSDMQEEDPLGDADLEG